MSNPLQLGKLPPALLRSLLEGGSPLPAEVRIGPAIGEDACAIDVDAGTLVAATDPITLTGSEVGAMAVTVNANDVAVMGVKPRWFLAAVLLPPGTNEQQVRELFESLFAALDGLGAHLVGGHTEVTSAVRQPVVVGQMLGMRADRAVVSTGGVVAGDLIVQAGPAPIEAAAVFAAEAPMAALSSLDAELIARARNAGNDPGISVVEAALLAAEFGAHALHDPTEGGLSSGLYEMADASQVRIRLDRRAILWFEPGRSVCAALGADPWGALASGALLAAFAPDAAPTACRALADAGFVAREIGIAEAGHGVVFDDGSPLTSFARDEVARVLGD